MSYKNEKNKVISQTEKADPETAQPGMRLTTRKSVGQTCGGSHRQGSLAATTGGLGSRNAAPSATPLKQGRAFPGRTGGAMTRFKESRLRCWRATEKKSRRCLSPVELEIHFVREGRRRISTRQTGGSLLCEFISADCSSSPVRVWTSGKPFDTCISNKNKKTHNKMQSLSLFYMKMNIIKYYFCETLRTITSGERAEDLMNK